MRLHVYTYMCAELTMDGNKACECGAGKDLEEFPSFLPSLTSPPSSFLLPILPSFLPSFLPSLPSPPSLPSFILPGAASALDNH